MAYERTNRRQQRMRIQASWAIFGSTDPKARGLRYLHAVLEMMNAKQALLHQPEEPRFVPELEGMRRGHTSCRMCDFLRGCDRDTTNRYGRGRRYRAALQEATT